MQIIQNRRDFLASLSVAGAAGVAWRPDARSPTRGRRKTTTIRLAKIPGICIAPQYVAEDLLRAEGFTDVRYVPTQAGDRGGHEDRARRDRFQPEFRGTARASRSMPASRSRLLAGVHAGLLRAVRQRAHPQRSRT